MKRRSILAALCLIAGAGRGLAAEAPALQSLAALAPVGGARVVEAPEPKAVAVDQDDTAGLSFTASAQAGCNVILLSFSDYAFTRQYHEEIKNQLLDSKYVNKLIDANLPLGGIAQFSEIGAKDEDFSRALIIKLKTMKVNEAEQGSDLSCQYVKDKRLASAEIVINQITSSDARHDLDKKKKKEIRNSLDYALKSYCK